MGRQKSDMKDGPGGLKNELNNAEKILILLFSADRGKAIPGNLWLQKEAFLISESITPLEEYFDFEAHLQGPFSEAVNNIAEDLQYLGLINRDRKGMRLTEKGNELAELIEEGTEEEILELITDTKSKLNNLTKDELLVYIYYSHPDMTTESLEKVDLEPKRASVASKLYRRGKVDLEKGADLAGMSLSEFEKQVT